MQQGPWEAQDSVATEAGFLLPLYRPARDSSPEHSAQGERTRFALPSAIGLRLQLLRIPILLSHFVHIFHLESTTSQVSSAAPKILPERVRNSSDMLNKATARETGRQREIKKVNQQVRRHFTILCTVTCIFHCPTMLPWSHDEQYNLEIIQNRAEPSFLKNQ